MLHVTACTSPAQPGTACLILTAKRRSVIINQACAVLFLDVLLPCIGAIWHLSRQCSATQASTICNLLFSGWLCLLKQTGGMSMHSAAAGYRGHLTTEQVLQYYIEQHWQVPASLLSQMACFAEYAMD